VFRGRHTKTLLEDLTITTPDTFEPVTTVTHKQNDHVNYLSPKLANGRASYIMQNYQKQPI
jgi:hypothetical protein